jgi:predicted nuclease with TOPRIM domain
VEILKPESQVKMKNWKLKEVKMKTERSAMKWMEMKTERSAMKWAVAPWAQHHSQQDAGGLCRMQEVYAAQGERISSLERENDLLRGTNRRQFQSIQALLLRIEQLESALEAGAIPVPIEDEISLMKREWGKAGYFPACFQTLDFKEFPPYCKGLNRNKQNRM